METQAKLTIVGAGSAADLITVRGLRAIQQADVVMFDRLADEKLLLEATGRVVNVGKLPYSHSVKQEEINRMICEELTAGRHVVRLKGGDSTLFSRAVEEIAVARDIGVPCEIVPGVTTASAAVARVETTLTSRFTTSGVMFITGHTAAANLASAYDWSAIVKLGLTVVVYMGVKNMAAIARHLTEAGMSPETPVMIAENVETESERYLRGTLQDVQHVPMKDPAAHPAILVIGTVLEHATGGLLPMTHKAVQK